MTYRGSLRLEQDHLYKCPLDQNEHLPPAAAGPEVLYPHRQEHEGNQRGGPSW